MSNHFKNIFVIIKNAQFTKKKFIYHENEKNSWVFLKLLWDSGFIMGFKICLNDKKKLKIFLKYENNQSSIKNLKIISKSTWWVYYSINQIYKIEKSKSFIVFSTNFGLNTIEKCKKLWVGGEPIIVIE